VAFRLLLPILSPEARLDAKLALPHDDTAADVEDERAIHLIPHLHVRPATDVAAKLHVHHREWSRSLDITRTVLACPGNRPLSPVGAMPVPATASRGPRRDHKPALR